VITPSRPALAELTAAPDYAGRVTAIVGRLAQAEDVPQALQVLEEASAAMGLDAAAFVSFIRHDASHESFRFLLACDPVWCIEYEHRAWYATDPWLTYAQYRSDPARGHEIPAASEQARGLMALAEQYGFRSSLIVPAPSSGNLTRMGVLCLGSNLPAFFEDQGYLPLKLVARGLAMELHGWWIEHFKRELIRDARLSEEDLRLLTLERRGLCTKRMVSELQMSPHAINSRFQRMNARLGVPNRRAAAQLAAEYGLI
jgi:DNA-binding CsgD family transcriptional regulator